MIKRQIEHALYLAIFLHMARKIARKSCTPRKRIMAIKAVRRKKYGKDDVDKILSSAWRIKWSDADKLVPGYDLACEYPIHERDGQRCAENLCDAIYTIHAKLAKDIT